MDFDLTISGAIPVQDGLWEELRHAAEDDPEACGELEPASGEE